MPSDPVQRKITEIGTKSIIVKIRGKNSAQWTFLRYQGPASFSKATGNKRTTNLHTKSRLLISYPNASKKVL